MLELNGNIKKRWSHRAGTHKYLITKSEYPIFASLLSEYLESGGTPSLEIIIPSKRKFHLFHQLINVLDTNYRKILRHLEHLIISHFQLDQETKLKYSLDGLENNYHQYRVFWYYDDQPLMVTKTKGERFLQKFKKTYPKMSRNLVFNYTTTPLIGTYLKVEENITDRYLPLCLNRVTETELHNFSILEY